jgi:YfiH family protein
LSEDGWQAVAAVIGAPRGVVTAHQVHGREVIVVRRESPQPVMANRAADVIVSNDPEVAVAVRAADCVPLLVGDSQTGSVAAIHAGWRGLAAGAIRAGLEAMAREFGANAAHLHVAIGPHIGVCCYEVGPELAEAFLAAGHPRVLVDRWFETRERRLHLNLTNVARSQLHDAGVPAAQIHIAGLCTAMHLDVLTSYRAEREKAGRIAGVIRAPVHI